MARLNMKNKFLLGLLMTIVFLGTFTIPVFAQEATATPRPTFGPTCTPSPAPAGPTATPTLPVTAGSPAVTSLAFILGTILLFGGLGASLLLTPVKKPK